MFGAETHNDVSGKIAKRRAEKLLEKFDLSERKNFMPKELSGGQQQRVAIARALANTPELLLADEPTAALDSVMGRKVMELLKQVAHEHNTGVLVVTHDHRAIDVFDRIYSYGRRKNQRAVIYFAKDDGSHLVWCGLLLVTNCRKYCNKLALICNKLRIVSEIGVDTAPLQKI